MKVNELINLLNKKFPEGIQEVYDNTGSQIIFNDERVKGIYVCLDADMQTVNDAYKKGCNLIISHHPLIFKPVKKISDDNSKSEIILNIIKNSISLYSIHTNFDQIMYKALADFLGYKESIPLLRTGELNGTEISFGSLKILEKEKKLSSIVSETKNVLNLDYIIYSGNMDMNINSIAFLNGSGGGSVEKVVSQCNPDCIITGDVNYHNAKFAIDTGKALIDAGHFGTEVIFKKMLAESISEMLSDINVEIIVSDIETNPLKIY